MQNKTQKIQKAKVHVKRKEATIHIKKNQLTLYLKSKTNKCRQNKKKKQQMSITLTLTRIAQDIAKDLTLDSKDGCAVVKFRAHTREMEWMLVNREREKKITNAR